MYNQSGGKEYKTCNDSPPLMSKRKILQEAEVCPHQIKLNDKISCNLLTLCLQVPTFKADKNQDIVPAPDQQWPIYSNLQMIPGKALPILKQTLEIKEILQRGIFTICQDLIIENAFPIDATPPKLTWSTVKNVAKN